MEIVDIIDKVTPISGDYKELIPPYMDSGHNGCALSLNRTEADRGSNPLRSTINSSGAVFCILGDYMSRVCVFYL